jgi:two-component system OmpR family response regulator
MGETILIVDDEPELREALQGLLEFEGYDARCAGDGFEALEQMEVTKARLIILDLMMPRMNGYEFLAELERRGLRQGILILILTADGGAKEKATRLGADGGFAKPFDSDALLEEIARLISLG